MGLSAVGRFTKRRVSFTTAVLGALLLVNPLVAHAQPASPPSATSEQKRDAATHLAAATKAERAKDFALAATEYRASAAAVPSAAAAQGIALAEDSLGHVLEAFAAYEQLLDRFGAQMSAKARTLAEGRLVELGEKTGTLAIHVVPEGAAVTVDGAAVALTAGAKSVRVLPGAHHVVATLSSFLPIDRPVEIAARANVAVDIALAAEPTTGTVVVREVKGEALTLNVDEHPVGPLPWTGELPAGEHDLTAASPTMLVPKQRIAVESKKKLEITLVAAPRVGRVEILTPDGRGFIVVDDKPVAEGRYEEMLPVGEHRIAVVREGFERAELTHVTVEGETWRETITLKAKKVEKEIVVPTDTHGVVGNLLFAGSFQTGSAGSESEANCAGLGSHCSASTPTGGGLLFAVGYMWKYIGADVLAGGVLDNGSRVYADTTGKPKSYSVARAGGIVALRARGAYQWEHFRATGAIGFGFSDRIVGTADGFPALPKDTTHYSSVAFTMDINGQWRMGTSTALVLGAMIWVENAGDGVTTLAAPTSGSFHLVSGSQTFLLPYIGFQFGP